MKSNNFDIPLMSMYTPGFSAGKAPERTISVRELYNMLREGEAQQTVERLRQVEDEKEQRRIKQTQLPYVKCAGTFTGLEDASLVQWSGLMCIDLDHIADVPTLRQQLLQDERLNVIMLFTSPRGEGIKMLLDVRQAMAERGYRRVFALVCQWLKREYCLTDHQVDGTCRNVGRATYLSWDPHCYIRENENANHTNYGD